MSVHHLPVDALHDWTRTLFESLGSPAEEAPRLTADHLVGANLAGHDSHGVGMVPLYVDARLPRQAGFLQLGRTAEVVHDSGPMLVVDGQRAPPRSCSTAVRCSSSTGSAGSVSPSPTAP